ncbi:MAG: hypothetical protein K8F31_11295, partial [Roseovarius sp.]|nr:hypothetical protein [Roseovarius sp.]
LRITEILATRSRQSASDTASTTRRSTAGSPTTTAPSRPIQIKRWALTGPHRHAGELRILKGTALLYRRGISLLGLLLGLFLGALAQLLSSLKFQLLALRFQFTPVPESATQVAEPFPNRFKWISHNSS